MHFYANCFKNVQLFSIFNVGKFGHHPVGCLGGQGGQLTVKDESTRYIRKRSAEFLTSTLIIFAVIAVVEMEKSLKPMILS